MTDTPDAPIRERDRRPGPAETIAPEELELHELPDRTALSTFTAGLAPGLGHLVLGHPLPIEGQPPDTASNTDAAE